MPHSTDVPQPSARGGRTPWTRGMGSRSPTPRSDSAGRESTSTSPGPVMEAIMRRKLVLGIAALIVVAVGAVAATYLRDTRRAYDRVLGNGAVITSPYGDIEYSEGGAGPAVVVIHGGGGGYDQGEILVETVLGDDFYWIAPSRFGYLRSRLPEDATWDDQANAFAYLLDQLGIETVAVVALSQGGPPALLLAALHPERVSSLTCLSCGVAPSTSEDQAEANKKGDLLKTVFGHNYLYWPISRYFKRQLMGGLGATPEVIASLTGEQREIIERLIDHMNPAAARSAGVVLDNEGAASRRSDRRGPHAHPDRPRQGRRAPALPQRRVRRRHHPGGDADEL